MWRYHSQLWKVLWSRKFKVPRECKTGISYRVWSVNGRLISSSLVFPCGSAGEGSACNAGDLGSISELGRSPEKGKGYPLHSSGLENSTDYSPWGFNTEKHSCSAFPSRVAKSDTTERLSLQSLHVGSFIPISLRRKLRFREVTSVAHGYTAIN